MYCKDTSYPRSQQERAKKRMEFDNQCNRIYNQLDFEKQRDTESTLNKYKFYIVGLNCDIKIFN